MDSYRTFLFKWWHLVEKPLHHSLRRLFAAEAWSENEILIALKLKYSNCKMCRFPLRTHTHIKRLLYTPCCLSVSRKGPQNHLCQLLQISPLCLMQRSCTNQWCCVTFLPSALQGLGNRSRAHMRSLNSQLGFFAVCLGKGYFPASLERHQPGTVDCNGVHDNS